MPLQKCHLNIQITSSSSSKLKVKRTTLSYEWMPTILSVLFYIINYQPHLGNPNSKFSIFHHMQHRLTCLYNGNLSNQVPASKSILNQNVHRSVIRTASTEPKKEKKLTGPFKSLSFETSPSPMASTRQPRTLATVTSFSIKSQSRSDAGLPYHVFL